MEWFFLILIILSSLIYALSSFFDNYVTDAYFRGRRPEAQMIFSLIAYAITAVAMLIFFPLTTLPPHLLVLVILAGAVQPIGTIFYYRALANQETTGTTILLQFSPVLALISGVFILGESITLQSILAIALLLIAALLIIYSRGKARLRVQFRAALLLLITMVFWVAADTLFILSGESFDFPTGFFYFLVGRVISTLILTLTMKSWRTRVKNVVREFRGRIIVTAFINEALDLAANILWRIAILSVPIAIATALENTAQLIATFAFGLVFTIVWPRFGREKLTKRTVSYHFAALLSCVFAILIIQFA